MEEPPEQSAHARDGAGGGHLRATLGVIAEVLQSPRLRRVALAFLVFNAVEAGAWVVILLYAYAATGPESVGLVALAQLLPAAVVAPLAATLGDGRSRHGLLLAGYATLAATLGLTACAMLSGWPPLAVYAAAIAASTSLVLVRPAQHSLLPEIAFTPQELTAANAVSSIAEALGILAGPLVVAALLAAASHGWALAVGAIAMAGAALLVLSLADRETSALAAPRTPADASVGSSLARYRRQVAEGFAALAGHRDARLLVLLLGGRTLMIGITDVLFVLLALEFFGTGESGAATLAAALGAGGIAGGAAAFLLVGQPRIAWIIAGASAGWGLALAILSLPGIGPVAPLVMVAGGTGLAVLDIACRTFLQRAVPFDVLSRVFGIVEGLSMVVLAVGSVLVTAVVAVVGLEASILVFAALLPAVVAFAWPPLSRLDARTLVPQRELALLRRALLFAALPPPALEGLARAAKWKQVPAGGRVLREGEVGTDYFLLESGSVVATRDGRFLRRMDAPAAGFGEIALLRDVPRTASITAERDSVLLVLGRNEFLAALTGNAGAAATAEQVTAARLLDRD
jgi:hypothetical protein